MHQRLDMLLKHILFATIALSIWFPATYPCLLFWGEYPYPVKEDE